MYRLCNFQSSNERTQTNNASFENQFANINLSHSSYISNILFLTLVVSVFVYRVLCQEDNLLRTQTQSVRSILASMQHNWTNIPTQSRILARSSSRTSNQKERTMSIIHTCGWDVWWVRMGCVFCQPQQHLIRLYPATNSIGISKRSRLMSPRRAVNNGK